MQKFTLFLVALCLILAPATAQQLEPNSPGGSLQSNGVDPTPGTPFLVTPNGTMNFEVGGNAGAGYSLVAGQLATTSITDPLLNGQFFDIDLNTAALVGDGIGGTSTGLPANLFFLNGNGTSSWSIPANPGLLGQKLAFQAVVFDAAQPPLNLNITAAAEFDFQNVTLLTGDDSFVSFSLLQPYSLYGQTYNQCFISTNGWIKFGVAPFHSDLSESTADFLSGNVGGAGAGSGPVVAALWEDLDMGNGNPGQQVIINEATPGLLTVTWQNGDYYPSTPFGTVIATIDVTAGVPQITLDYMGYSAMIPPTEGIVGVSDGGVAMAVANEVDLVQGGAVVPTGGLNPAETIFQNFGTGAFPEAVDLAGTVLNFVDASGTGQFTLF